MKQIDLTTATKEQISDAIDNLVYANYKWNRQQFPRWTVDQLTVVYGQDAYLMEIKYQEEIK